MTGTDGWLTLQQIRNLTGLSAGELRTLRNQIGHVEERSDGARKSGRRIEFFRAWFGCRESEEDEYVKRRRIALALKAERDSELTAIELERKRGELFTLEEIDEDLKLFGRVIRAGVEEIEIISPESAAIMTRQLDELDNDWEKTTDRWADRTILNGKPK